MKYALEYDPTNQNALTIHFDKELLECPSQELSEKDMSGGITYGCMTHRENNTIVDDGENNKNNIEPIFYGNIKKETISQYLKTMGETIYSLNGLREVEICDYEIILLKSLFIEWDWVVNSVVATVLMFIEPDGKATEMPFANTHGRNNKKGRKNKKFSKKTAEISWKFQET